MNNPLFIIDLGLFIGKELLHYSPPESYETIINLLKTIKEYRDFSQPNSPSWEEYVLGFFHILGFKTENIDSHLISLTEIGEATSPTVVLSILKPDDRSVDPVHDKNWGRQLFDIIHDFQTDWLIITDGLQIKIYQMGRQDFQETYLWVDLDGIIEQQMTDSFLYLYNVFSFIRGREGNNLNKFNLLTNQSSRILKNIGGRISKISNGDIQKKGFVTGYCELSGYPKVPPQKIPTKADCEDYDFISMVQLCNIAQDNNRSRSSACRAFGGDNGEIPVIPERQARVSFGHRPWKFVLVSSVREYFSEVGIEW